MKAFSDENRAVSAVEPICRELQIAPSTYYLHAARDMDLAKQSARIRRDTALCVDIRRVFDKNRQAYGARKVWHQLHRDGQTIASCTVERLRRRLDIRGVVRGKYKAEVIHRRS